MTVPRFVAFALLAPLVACAHRQAAEPAEPVRSAAAAPEAHEPAAARSSAAPDAKERAAERLALAKRGRATTDVVAIENALENYALNNSMRYPDTLEPLVTSDVNGHTYLRTKTVPKDPWGRDYVYEEPVKGGPRPRIVSLGRDGLPGGTGEDADIDNVSIRNE